MSTKNHFNLKIQPDLPDAIHSFRLYRASITPEYYELGIALGIVSLLFGGLILLIVAGSITQEILSNQPIEASNFASLPIRMLPVFIGFGVLAIFDAFSSIRLWLQFRQNKDYYLKPRNVIFSDEQIEIQGESIDARYKWDFFSGCVEGCKEFILIYGKMMYFTIPKHVFQNENEVEAFRMLIKEKLPNFKQKLKIWLDFQK